MSAVDVERHYAAQERNLSRAKEMYKRTMRIGACFDLAGIAACDDSLPEGLEQILRDDLPLLKKAMGPAFTAIMEKIDPEDDDDIDGADDEDRFFQFVYAIEVLNLNGFLISAQQQSPPDGSGWGVFTYRLFYGHAYEDALQRAFQWGDENIRQASGKPAPAV